MSGDMYTLIQILVIALITVLIRALPFLVFPADKKLPDTVAYLGRVLPYATMGMLVVYCLKNVSFVTSPYGIPEFIAVAVTLVSYIFKKSSLLSIVLGTALYMLLI